jgi:exonuclease SbcC
MRVSYLELRNYRRFRSLKLEFPDGIIGILGLNGAGKSTVIEGMAWALFGNEQEVVRTSRESIRRAGAGPKENVAAVLEFEMEGVEYRLEREMGGRSLTMKATLTTRDGTAADGDRAVRTAVQKLLGMDHKSFFTSVFARQKELNELQDFPASERKKVVLRMLRIDGIDAAIKLVREDRKSVSQQIQGAEGMLLDGDGKDREAETAERMKELSEAVKAAELALSQAQKKRESRVRDLDKVRERRNALAKDFEAFKTADADLRATRRSMAEMREREAKIVSKVGEIEEALTKMPELERADKEWQEAREKKDALDEEKERFDRRNILSEDVAGIEKELGGLMRRLEALRRDAAQTKDIQDRIGSISVMKREAEGERAVLSDRLAEMRARIEDRSSRLKKERARLEDIRRAGKEGACPTCERTLEEAYDPLVAKLERGLQEAESEATDDSATMKAAQADLAACDKRIEALDKKHRHSEELMAKARDAEVATKALTDEVTRTNAKLEDRAKEIGKIGELRFSPGEYRRVREASGEDRTTIQCEAGPRGTPRIHREEEVRGGDSRRLGFRARAQEGGLRQGDEGIRGEERRGERRRRGGGRCESW